MIDGTEVSLYALNAIVERVDPLLREIPGVVKAEDPECLHRMRVASRRLRMSLNLLGARAGLSDASAVKFFRLIRKVTRRLGEARDIDVQLLWLKDFEPQCTKRELPGVRRIALRLNQKREKLQPGIVKLVSSLPEDPIFVKTIEDVRIARVDAEIAGKNSSQEDQRYATRSLLLQLDTVQQHALSLEDPEASEAHHSFRKEVKHLRYAMEIFRGLYGDKLDEHIQTMKKLQGLLGELQDANIWVDMLPVMKLLEIDETKRYFGTIRFFFRLQPGYDKLLTYTCDIRALLYTNSFNFCRQSQCRFLSLKKIILECVNIERIRDDFERK